MSAFPFQTWWLGPGGRIKVYDTLLKEVIEQKPNSGQVLPLGGDAAGVAL